MSERHDLEERRLPDWEGEPASDRLLSLQALIRSIVEHVRAEQEQAEADQARP